MKTFVLTEEQQMLLELARDLAQAEIAPLSEGVDHTGSIPAQGVSALAEAGLLCCAAPEEFGGAGLDWWSQSVVIEETARQCASTALLLSGGTEVAECLLKHGTPEQKARLVPLLAGGERACAAGSDSAPGAAWSVSLTAEKRGTDYVLNGVKKQVPNGGLCAWYLVAAREEEQLLWFLVRGDQAGLTARPGAPRLGMKGCPVADLVFDGCQVTAQSLVPGPVEGTLSAARSLNMAAIAVGVAQGALAEAIEYVNQRVQFGKTIAQFQNTQQVAAQLLAQAEAARALVWEAARVKDSGEAYAGVASMAKVVASDMAAVATRKCVQFMGGYGYSREYPVERRMRDAKMTELLGGATMEHNEAIARAAVVR